MIKKIRYKDRDEWLQIRKSGIGGSEAGIVMGVSEYGSPLTIWADKTGIGKPIETNLPMKIGNYLEPLVAAEFEERTGKKVQERHYMMQNDLYPWAIGNIDRKVIGENAILECKTTGSIPRIRGFKNGEYPDEWYCQCQHYMAVGGYDRAYLACIVRNLQCDYVDWVIQRDDEFIAEMMRREEALWQKVLTKTPPDPAGAERERDVLREMFDAKPEETEDISSMRTAIKEYTEYADLEKQYNQLKEAAKNRICLALGNACIGTIDGKKVVTWRTVDRKEHVVKASSSRQFRLYK